MNILAECDRLGVRLAVDGDALKVDAPKGAVTDELKERLRANKADILRQLAVDQAEDLREHFEERAGILEYDAGLPRAQAELEAARITVTYARNCCYQWASLRVALSAYPELLTSLPDKTGPVDSLPLGVSKIAVLSGKRSVRQGIFTVEHEV